MNLAILPPKFVTYVAVSGIGLYIDVGHCILSIFWLRGRGMLGM